MLPFHSPWNPLIPLPRIRRGGTLTPCHPEGETTLSVFFIIKRKGRRLTAVALGERALPWVNGEKPFNGIHGFLIIPDLPFPDSITIHRRQGPSLRAVRLGALFVALSGGLISNHPSEFEVK